MQLLTDLRALLIVPTGKAQSGFHVPGAKSDSHQQVGFGGIIRAEAFEVHQAVALGFHAVFADALPPALDLSPVGVRVVEMLAVGVPQVLLYVVRHSGRALRSLVSKLAGLLAFAGGGIAVVA